MKIPYAGEDMYRAILKEIGAEGSNMGYLFDEDDEDNREVEESIIIQGNNHTVHTGVVAIQHLKHNQQLKGEIFDSDNELFNQWESEVEGVVDPVEMSQEGEESTTNDTNSGEINEPVWKKMLEAATAEQKQLMGQMINLQMAQKKSSPRNKVGEIQLNQSEEINQHQEKEDENKEDQLSSSTISENVEINDDQNLSAFSSTPLVQHLSSRNAKLQDEWQSQQVETVKLKDKMNAIQAKLYDQQQQWEKDQEELFSPTRSKTKIPRWRESTGSVAATPTLQSKIHNTDWVSPPNISLQQVSEYEIRHLESLSEVSTKVQRKHKKELDGYKNQLNKCDLEHQALLLQYETEKKLWQDDTKEMNSRNEIEIQYCQNDLENARDKLHQQISFNQNLREENQKLKSSNKLEEELDETQNQIKFAKEELEQEFESRVNVIQSRHDEELEVWKSKADDQRRQLEMNDNNFLSKLEEANIKYTDLEQRYDRGVFVKEELVQEFESRVNIIQSRHDEELEVWKSKADEQRRQMGMNDTNFLSKLDEANIQYTDLEQRYDRGVKDLQILLDKASRHEEKLQYWKKKVDDQSQQMQISNKNFKTQLEESNARFADLEQKHDKEIKEWQMLLDADINSKGLNEIDIENGASGAWNKNGTIATKNMIGGIGLELLSPIRKASSTRQSNNDVDISSDSSSSSISVHSAPSESMDKIDNLLKELGQMGLEQTAILNEINSDDVQIESDDPPSTSDSVAMIFADGKPEPKVGELQLNDEGTGDEDIPRLVESPAYFVDGNGEETNVSNTTSDSEVLDQTLSLLNNLKNMMTCQGEGNEYESTVIERLGVLSELMQDQSGYESLLSSVDQEVSGKQHYASEEESFDISTSRGNDTSWISTMKAAADNPWPALVAELRFRCEFLERDRDNLTRITEQILGMERTSHRVELEAAVATAERKASENLHQVQLETNREMNSIYQSICVHCQRRVYTVL